MEQEIKYWAAKDGYLVNRDGTIYKMNWRGTGKMKKVKQHKRSDGRLGFLFKGENILAHRFIAELFIPNPNNLPQVNHKDENPLNNCVDNLEWCDCKYNSNYGTRNKRVSKSMKNNPKISKPVLQYTLDGKFVAEYQSANEVQRQLGYYESNVSACCRGESKQAYGHLWRWKNQPPTT